MTKKTVAVVLVAFALANAVVIFGSGWPGLRHAIVTANPWIMLLFSDLGIALTLCAVWIFRDARSRGVSPLPYLVLTYTLGSIGPLLYLMLRPAEPGGAGMQRGR